ncbi:hypothetical protein R5R35_012337 [Gryllus longicercus]|uniref:protein-ribulosamine 3-kinase n=1 Tax=Gryllus longicercus TaxID=2509291 RepID=A0AAN9YZL3_9ORTH
MRKCHLFPNMEAILKNALHTNTLVPTGYHGGGCINDGEGYKTDQGVVFVKSNNKSEARRMFEGEYAGLKAIKDTNTIQVPNPIVVVDNPKGGAALALQFVDIKGLSKYKQLGEQLAALHLHNIELVKHGNPGYVGKEEGPLPVEKFGFHTTTCCGYIPMENEWCDNWIDFFTRQRLDMQLRMIETEYGDREARELWVELQHKIPKFFEGIEITPSLLHGDLWSGNAGDANKIPIVFDPAAFYGHHEYDLAIMGMFGGFGRATLDAYHKAIPKANGFSDRHQLYQLFHYLNHWNHFGQGYRVESINIMKTLLKV